MARLSVAMAYRITSKPRTRPLSAQERVDVSGKLIVVLEQETVRGVWIDLDVGLWDKAAKDVGVSGKDHGITVAVRDEYGHPDRAHPLEQSVVGNAPGTDSVVLGLPGLPGRCGIPA